MRWPIRNQILLPVAALQIAALVAVAVYASWVAVESVESEISGRLEGVRTTLEESTFPLTPAVLDQLHQLSGAHFTVVDENRIATDATLMQSKSVVDRLSPEDWAALGGESLEDWLRLEIEGRRYFAGEVKPGRGVIGEGGAGATLVILYSEESWEQARWQAVSPPLLIGAILLLVTVSATTWIARRIGGRMQRVESHVSRIAEGDFTPLPTGSLNDELRDLAISINRMASALDDAFQQAGERERSSLLTQLVGGLSHQLRNALTGARMAVQLHQRNCDLKDDALDVALRQLSLTEQQIKSLLRVTRGEQRSILPGELGSILRETVALLSPLCEHQKITIDFTDDPLTLVIPDGDALRAAVLNLLMNAVEAAGPGGEIGLRTQLGAEQVVLEVYDNGPGLPPEVGDQVFAPFYSTKPEGIGLGLALTVQAAQDLGGELKTVREEGMTVFRLTLPCETTVG